MLPSRIRPRPTLFARPTLVVLALLSLCSLSALAPTVFAAAPAKVTIEVEGLSETKVPPTQVTTVTAAVVKDGIPADSCSGTSALGALEVATGGDWGGPWSGTFHQYEIYSIKGETHQFDAESQANYYWSFWLDHKEASTGACEAELEQGQHVLFFPACFGEACPPAQTPLGIDAPASANAGEAVTVTVQQYSSTGQATPYAGANVAGGGVSATTDFQGHATLIFSGDGTYTLHANASNGGPPAVRTETSICVHEGNDGTCGTTLVAGPSPVTGSPGSSSGPPAHRGPAVVAQATSVTEGHIYAHGHGPRLLTGNVVTQSAVTSIGIELRRRNKGRCAAYNATRERFVRARCGKGQPFKVANGGTSFSYLLPAKLSPGRYVLDLLASDAAGNHTVLARRSSRIVFYVR